MPVTIKKVDGYRVSTPGGVKSKNTSARKAIAQKRLLQGVEHGWHPTGKQSNLKHVAIVKRASKK